MQDPVVLGTGLLVEGTGDYFEPPLTSIIPTRSCHVVIRLDRVYYGGDDVGSDWRFNTSVDGQYWDSGPLVFQHNTTRAFGADIFDRGRPNACDHPQLLSLAICAREKDWLFDDVGHALQPLILPCSDTLWSRRLVVTIPVAERAGLPCSRPTKGPKVALLLFFFSIRTQCV